VGRLGFRVGVSASYSNKIISFQFLPITGIIACPAVIKVLHRGQAYFAECGLRNVDHGYFAECGMRKKTCGMRSNLRNGKMRKSHLTAYKLLPASIATIYIHNKSSAVSK